MRVIVSMVAGLLLAGCPVIDGDLADLKTASPEETGSIDSGSDAPVDGDGDGYSEADGDCNDSDPNISPTAADDIDGIDQNCDGIDGVDIDQDQHASLTSGGQDCNDEDDTIHPGADEFCNEVDDDCDGELDESAVDAVLWYVDSDGDGYGQQTTTEEACAAPSGYVANQDDCDDSDSDACPGCDEIPRDYIDNDCDGSNNYQASIISASTSLHSCALEPDGVVSCWGDNLNGRASNPGGGFLHVSAGYFNTCAVRDTGELSCWGYQPTGQSTPPTGTFIEVSMGQYHGCAISTAQEIVCWGQAILDQLDSPSGSFVQVDAGYEHTCAIDTAGALHCWGDDENSAVSDTPTTGTWTQVSGGNNHTCAIDSASVVHCWGPGHTKVTDIPNDTFQHVSAGHYNTCGVTTLGAVRCWGTGNHGQNEAPAGTYRTVSAGVYHTCALDTADTVVCWGAGVGEVSSDCSGDQTWECGQSTPPRTPPQKLCGHVCGFCPPLNPFFPPPYATLFPCA